MTGREVAQHFNAKEIKRGKLWLTLCPAHPDRKPSLSIQEGKKGVQLYCNSHHCNFFDIVRAAGLKPEMLFYDHGTKVDPKARAEMQRKRDAEEKLRREWRIGSWCIRFIRNGYTQEDEDSDMDVIVACCIVLSQQLPNTSHWESILRTHLERMEAARYCGERGMLPKTATPRWEAAHAL